jgi:hypothetical protein
VEPSALLPAVVVEVVEVVEVVVLPQTPSSMAVLAEYPLPLKE